MAQMAVVLLKGTLLGGVVGEVRSVTRFIGHSDLSRGKDEN